MEKPTIDDILAAVEKLFSDDRSELFDRLKQNYCIHCGCDNPRCHCENDY